MKKIITFGLLILSLTSQADWIDNLQISHDGKTLIRGLGNLRVADNGPSQHTDKLPWDMNCEELDIVIPEKIQDLEESVLSLAELKAELADYDNDWKIIKILNVHDRDHYAFPAYVQFNIVKRQKIGLKRFQEYYQRSCN
jgi:hypothetical protein